VRLNPSSIGDAKSTFEVNTLSARNGNVPCADLGKALYHIDWRWWKLSPNVPSNELKAQERAYILKG